MNKETKEELKDWGKELILVGVTIAFALSLNHVLSGEEKKTLEPITKTKTETLKNDTTNLIQQKILQSQVKEK